MKEFNSKLIALVLIKGEDEKANLYSELLIENEKVEFAYKTVRDRLVLTDKRLLMVDVQGITGSKKSFVSIPYSKITSWAVESAGTFDLDAEMKVWLSGMGGMEFAFKKGSDIATLSKFIASKVL